MPREPGPYHIKFKLSPSLPLAYPYSTRTGLVQQLRVPLSIIPRTRLRNTSIITNPPHHLAFSPKTNPPATHRYQNPLTHYLISSHPIQFQLNTSPPHVTPHLSHQPPTNHNSHPPTKPHLILLQNKMAPPTPSKNQVPPPSPLSPPSSPFPLHTPSLPLSPLSPFSPQLTNTQQTPLEKAHAARAAKKSKREAIKTRRMEALEKARAKKRAAK